MPFYLVSVLVDVWILQVTNKFRRLLMALPERDLESLAQGYRACARFDAKTFSALSTWVSLVFLDFLRTLY